jgi:uncharacterized protein
MPGLVSPENHREKSSASIIAKPKLPWLRVGDSYLTVEITARPGSPSRQLLKTRTTGPVVRMVSAPEKGRANRELIEFMAEIAGVAASAVSIIKGQGARQKVIRIETPSPQKVMEKLRLATGF